MPSADFCAAVRRPRDRLSRLVGDTEQTSRGKLNRLRCTTAGSTLYALDGYGLRDTSPARPALAPRIRFLFIGSHLCSTLPSDPASRRQPLRFTNPSPPSGWVEDFHLRAIEHARHTTCQPSLDTQPDRRIARIRLSDKTSRLHPRRAATKLGQAYEPEVLVKVREWISSALASPDFVLEAQPPAQPHSRVVVEHPIRFAGGSNAKVIGPSVKRAVQLIHQPCGLLPSTRSVGQRVDSFDHALEALL